MNEPDEADFAAARDTLWPGVPADAPLIPESQAMLARVAQAFADLSADADDAWRHAREAEADLERARQQLLDSASVASAAVDTATLKTGVRLALNMLHTQAADAVSRSLTMAYAIGLAEGEKQAARTCGCGRAEDCGSGLHPDEELDPEAVRAVAQERLQRVAEEDGA